jgi:hypothetical protein
MKGSFRTGFFLLASILCGWSTSWIAGCSTAPDLESIAVTPPLSTVAKGLNQQFTAVGTFRGGITKDLTATVTWASTDTTVATVSNTAGSVGLATAIETGSTRIRASLKGVDGVVDFTVGPAIITSIAVTPANQTFPQNFPVQLIATGTFSDKSSQDVTSTVTWSSSQTDFASISSGGVATGQGQGTSSIQAALGGVQGATNINITSATLVGLVVSPQNPSIADTGVTLQFAANARFSDGSSLDATSVASWASSNTQIASIDSAAVARSLAIGAQTAGFSSIQAVLGTATGVSILTVTNHAGNGFAGVFTQRNDIGRTGQNINETILTPANVNSTSFGKVFSQPVDGNLYAQPLYVPNVSITGKGTHNVIYVATENDSVYAFDADNDTGSNANPLWQVSLVDAAHGAGPGARPVNSAGDVVCYVIDPHYGITSTPVIDPSAGTIYVEAISKENGVYFHRLHALDITTGLERSQSPVVIRATVPGTGDGSVNGMIAFNPARHTNRPGLLLVNGSVYVAFASTGCDQRPFHGWIFAFDSVTLSQQAVLNTTPNGEDGGIWMAGAGIAADSNANIFLATGNGTFDTTNIPATQLGDSILKLSLNGNRFLLLDYFSPFNQGVLDTEDSDLGSGGVLLLPGQQGPYPNELVEAGKSLKTYVIDRDQMTTNNLHNCLTNCDNEDPQIVQESSAAGVMFSAPAFWNNNIYLWGSGSVVKSFSVSNGVITLTGQASSNTSIQFPGANVVISANGTSNAIVWAVDGTHNRPLDGVATGPSVLYAFDATDVANLLYTSNQAANNRDIAGGSNKFVVPTIANGRIYIGTQAELDVYGLLATAAAAVKK